MNRNDRAIVSVLMPAHGLIHTYELSIPLFVAIWLEQFSVTEANIGLIVATGYILFGVGALPGGILSDRYESRPLVIASMGGIAGSFLLLSLSPSAVGLTLALVVWGLAASVYHPSALSLISHGVEHRGSAFAYHGMTGNVGTALGPFVTAVLLLLVEWRLAVAFLGAVGIVTTLAASRTTFNERAATEEMAADGDDVGGGRTGTGTDERPLPETFEGFFNASRTFCQFVLSCVPRRITPGAVLPRHYHVPSGPPYRPWSLGFRVHRPRTRLLAVPLCQSLNHRRHRPVYPWEANGQNRTRVRPLRCLRSVDAARARVRSCG
jgi:MFS family permease